MRRVFKFFLSLSATMFLHDAWAQANYTTELYAYDSILHVPYGTAVDYAGNSTTLHLDIYKPTGDGNCLRPVMLVAHGGAWIAGSKEDPNVVALSRSLAKKGWVVAAINYRLGTHKAANYDMYAFCNTSLAPPCGYIADSAEVYRANFRAMQDLKGAIRFMKARNDVDSTDIYNFFLTGESAGGFIALAAAFTDDPAEKHASCGAIGPAPSPDADMMTYGCIPATNDLTRPDLGDIEGDLNLGVYDARVSGVANIYGGVLDTSIFNQLDHVPSVYLYHQGSDVVVHYDYGRLLGRMSWECFAQSNLCQTYYFYPYAFGSEGIRQHFVDLAAAAPPYQAEIVPNYAYMNNCLSNGHSIDNPTLRFQQITDFFAPQIESSGNDPALNCAQMELYQNDDPVKITVYPNPFGSALSIKWSGMHGEQEVQLMDYTGRLVLEKRCNSGDVLQLSELSNAIYYLRIGDKVFDLIRVPN